MSGATIRSILGFFGMGVLLVGLSVPAIAGSSSGDSNNMAGGHTIGGPGFFDTTDPNGEQIFNTDRPQPLCLTLEGEKGTTQARFDAIPDIQVSASETRAVCRDAKSTIDLACISGDCKTKWRVDTPEVEDEIIVNAPVGPQGPQGPKGPEGPVGPQGPPGSIENASLEVVAILGSVETVPSGGTLETFVACPIGRFVISAGYRSHDPNRTIVSRVEISPSENRAFFTVTSICRDFDDEEFCLISNFTPIVNCARFQ